MHTLHLIGLDSNRLIHAVKGVRAARKALGDSLGASLVRSKEAVDSYKRGERVLVGEHEDAGTIQVAAQALETASSGACRAGIDMSEVDWGVAEAGAAMDSSDEAGSAEAYKTAMALLYAGDGKPGSALTYAVLLANTTGDPDLYEEVCSVILSVFPPDDAAQVVLVK